jgi:hypothetical protein
MEAAMDFLATSDDDFGAAKAQLLRSEILAKRVRARVFVAEEGPIELRKAKAENHPEVIAADEALIGWTLDFEKLKAKRQRAELLIDVWRSVESSRRKS